MTDALNHEGEAMILDLMWSPKVGPKLLPLVRPEYFEVEAHRILWSALSAIVARGDEVEVSVLREELRIQGHTLDDAGGIDYIASLLGSAPGISDPRPQAKLLRNRWTTRTLQSFCRKTVGYLEAGPADGGKKMAEYLASKALDLFSDQGVAAPMTRKELLASLWAESLEEGEQAGVDLPWPKMNEEVGPLAPGEIMGISAYSGGGKTTLVGNMAVGILPQATPIIIFGTEMGKRWVARMAAILSKTSQWCAEKRIWKRKVDGQWVPWPEGRDRYHRALRIMENWPMEFVPSPDITPREVITRTKVLRRKYAGQHVISIVDHMHRLDYGGQDPAKLVGQATRHFKNSALEDADGITYILLYQPRKPEDVDVVDRPVSYHQIRGDALVGNELDIHISPFRSWVKTEKGLYTPWGTPRALAAEDNLPVLTDKPDKPVLGEAGVKLSDEHVFVANDKRRIDGPGPIHVLSLHKPSGRMWEGFQDSQLKLMEGP